jgi:hypothetical protein
MEKKLIGLLVVTLLFITPVLSGAGTIQKSDPSKGIPPVHSALRHPALRGAPTSVDQQSQKISPHDGVADDRFGRSVDILYDYAIVGAPGHNTDSGAAYIYTPTSTSWDFQQKLEDTQEPGNREQFGFSVAITWDYAIIGIPYKYTDKGGMAQIWKRTGTVWEFQIELQASDGVRGNSFGFSVDILDEYAVVGAPLADNGKGAAYIFKRVITTSGETWVEQVPILRAPDGSANDKFGFSVALNFEVVIVGAPYDDDGRGSVYAWQLSPVTNRWDYATKRFDPMGAAGDEFGYSVDIAVRKAIVGAPGNSPGSAWIYDITSWYGEEIVPDIRTSRFGESVANEYHRAIIGTSAADNYKGMVFRFWSSTITGQKYIQVTTHSDSYGAQWDGFGKSVAIWGEYTIVGAPGDDGSMGSVTIFETIFPGWFYILLRIAGELANKIFPIPPP